jgi:hypothetical protein
MEAVEKVVDAWTQEVKDSELEDDEAEGGMLAWDDIHGGGLPADLVKETRMEEMGFMEGGLTNLEC